MVKIIRLLNFLAQKPGDGLCMKIGQVSQALEQVSKDDGN
jgi:hypothetical protein